jgi:hypothetical protein
MTTSRLSIAFITAFFISLFCLCTENNTVNGGGSSTGNANTITGLLVEPNGITPASSCNIYLFPKDSIPSFSGTLQEKSVAYSTSDSNGRYILKNLPDGNYNLFCNDTDRQLSKLILGKSVSNNDSLYSGVDTLRYEKAFAGTVNNTEGIPTIAFIYGSPFITAINDTSGFFRFDGIPMESDLSVSFKATQQINGKQCQANYRITQLPDTALYVTITLECQ